MVLVRKLLFVWVVTFFVHPAFSETKCEDCVGTAYDPSEDQCCGGDVIKKSKECCGDETTGEEAGVNGCCDILALNSGQVCCDGESREVGDECCGTLPMLSGDLCCYPGTPNQEVHSGAGSEICCGSSHYMGGGTEACCLPKGATDNSGGAIWDSTRDLCCDGTVHSGVKAEAPGADCCGTTAYFIPPREDCCKNANGDKVATAGQVCCTVSQNGDQQPVSQGELLNQGCCETPYGSYQSYPPRYDPAGCEGEGCTWVCCRQGGNKGDWVPEKDCNLCDLEFKTNPVVLSRLALPEDFSTYISRGIASDYKWTVSVTEGPGGVSLPSDTAPSVVYTNDKGLKFDLSAVHREDSNCKKILSVEGVEFFVRFDDSEVCDGAETGVSIGSFPRSAKDQITNVHLDVQGEGGLKQFDNPDGKGITIDQSNGGTSFPIDNARWFSTNADHSNEKSKYQIVINQSSVDYKGQTIVFVANGGDENPALTVSAETNCINGRAQITRAFSGEPNFDAHKVGDGYVYKFIDYGSFKRDPHAVSNIWVHEGENSQYYSLVEKEEEFHVQQVKNPTHPICGKYFKVKSVLDKFNEKKPLSYNSREAAINAAKKIWQSEAHNVRVHDQNELYRKGSDNRCKLEKEAKKAAGKMYLFSIKNKYPECI